MQIELERLLVVSRARQEPIPPASQRQVDSFEQSIGFQLPADYREFLLKFNGGRINKEIVHYVEFQISPLINGSVARSGKETVECMYSLFDKGSEWAEKTDSVQQLLWAYGEFSGMAGDFPFVPPQCIPIGSVPGGGQILLALAGSYKNKVLFYFSEEDPDELYGNVSLAGNSFSEFMESWDPIALG